MKKSARAYKNTRIRRNLGCCVSRATPRREDIDSYQPRLATGNTLTHRRKAGRVGEWLFPSKP